VCRDARFLRERGISPLSHRDRVSDIHRYPIPCPLSEADRPAKRILSHDGSDFCGRVWLQIFFQPLVELIDERRKLFLNLHTELHISAVGMEGVLNDQLVYCVHQPVVLCLWCEARDEDCPPVVHLFLLNVHLNSVKVILIFYTEVNRFVECRHFATMAAI